MRDPYQIYIGRRKSFFTNLSLTTWLIIINVVFFILALFLGALSSLDCGQTICNYIALQGENVFKNFYLWTFITSMFMHGGFPHLLVNMIVLFSLGGLCESIIGRKRYFWFYLLSGIFAGLVFLLFAYFFGSCFYFKDNQSF